MIQPLNALTPKVLFRGDDGSSQAINPRRKTLRTYAIVDATGISVGLGAATMAIARSNTSSWKHAGYFGIGAALLSMMFLLPGFLYKAGFNVTKSGDADFFQKEIANSKKILAETGEISQAAKNTAKSTIKAFPKV